MSDSHFLTNSFLHSLGYANEPVLQVVAARTIQESAQEINFKEDGFAWRDIFDYIACVEFARYSIRQLVGSKPIDGRHALPAQYNSAALVFFAQAALDNIALWTSKKGVASVSGSDCAFHKRKFQVQLIASFKEFDDFFNKHEAFIVKLEKFRQEWIHRMAGGARLFSEKVPSDPTADISIMIPISPEIPKLIPNQKRYIRAVERTRTNSNGEWLQPVEEFSDSPADGLRLFSLDFLSLAVALNIMKE